MVINETNKNMIRKDFFACVVLYDKEKNELSYSTIYFIGNGEYYPSYNEEHISLLLEVLQEQSFVIFGNLYPVDVDMVIDLKGNVIWEVKEEEEENEEASNTYKRIHEVYSERTT